MRKAMNTPSAIGNLNREKIDAYTNQDFYDA